MIAATTNLLHPQTFIIPSIPFTARGWENWRVPQRGLRKAFGILQVINYLPFSQIISMTSCDLFSRAMLNGYFRISAYLYLIVVVIILDNNLVSNFQLGRIFGHRVRVPAPAWDVWGVWLPINNYDILHGPSRIYFRGGGGQ